MPLTVRDLVKMPTLRTRLLAGERGADKPLTWAHSCEVARPLEWMGNSELLMTTGQNFPAEAPGQMTFVRELAKAGLAGLALAEAMAPELTLEAAAEADRLDFPVLETAYEVPFILLSRAVAETSQRDSQLTKIIRIYDTYRQATGQGADDPEILSRISKEVGAELQVINFRTGEVVVPGTVTRPGEIDALVERLTTKDHLPAVTRFKSEDDEFLALPIGDGRVYALVARVTGATFDLVVLQHVSTIGAVQAEHRRAWAEARLNGGARLLDQLLEAEVDAESALVRLSELDVCQPPWVVVAVEARDRLQPLSVQNRLLNHGVHALMTDTSPQALMLLGSRQDAIPLLEELVGPQGRIGVSDATATLSGIPDAAREALWAKQATRIEGSRTSYYGKDRPLFLPGTVSEANAAISRVLGPLLAYDEEHGTDLVLSLQTYFDEKRSWQAASSKLFIHRQTSDLPNAPSGGADRPPARRPR